jgi:hypothetical protein
MNVFYLSNSRIFSYGNALFFVNNFGVIKLKLPALNDILLYCSQSYLVIRSKVNINHYPLMDKIARALDISNFEFTNKLILFGVGFKSWDCKIKEGFRFIILKVGLSKDIVIKIPFTIKVVVLKPTLILFKCLDKNILNQYVSSLRSLKVPDPYKGKGLRYADEIPILKPGKT